MQYAIFFRGKGLCTFFRGLCNRIGICALDLASIVRILLMLSRFLCRSDEEKSCRGERSAASLGLLQKSVGFLNNHELSFLCRLIFNDFQTITCTGLLAGGTSHVDL
jgi:hypothetical protein